MTTKDLIGRRVSSGEGEDHDTGRIVRIINEQMVEVSWDSGVCTPAPIDLLDLEEEE